ncbi:MAG TPA: WD40 repeat domain-containing protein [Pirellulales bacterium]|nr:WD40 repeat domain-containing protein [Pirellulales bacterium]
MNHGLLVGIATALLLASTSRMDLMALEGDADDAPKAGVDLYGDPLPEGAALRMGTLRLRHKQFIQSAAFSPDGSLLASTAANDDVGVAFWDANTGALVRRLPVARANVHAGGPFAFSPNGEKSVTGDGAGTVQLWDLATGQELLQLAAHDGERGGVTSVAFSPDGKRFASAGGDGVVRIWTAEGEATFSVEAQPGPLVGVGFAGGPPPGGVIAPLVFSPDGKLLAAGAAKILIWNVETGELTMAIDGGPAKLVSLCFTPDGAQLISGGTREVPREKFGKPYDAKNVWLPEIRFWNVADGEQVRALTPNEPEAGYGAVALSNDGRTLAAGYEEKLLIWDLPSAKVARTIAVPKWWGERGLAISPNGKVVAAPLDNSLGMWDATTGMPLLCELQSHTSWIPSVAYGAEGTLIVTGGGDGTVRAWDAATGRPRYVHRLDGRYACVNAVALSPDRRVLAAGGGYDRRGMSPVLLLHADSGKTLEFPLLEDDEKHSRQAVGRLAFSRDGALLAVARHENDLEVWDVTSGRNVVRISTEFLIGTRSMAFSPDAKTVYAFGLNEAVVRSWDLAGVKQPGEFKAINTKIPHGDPKQRPWVSDAVFLPEGKHLVTSQNRDLVIWELATGEPLWTIRTPGTDKGRTLGLSPDGRLLALCDLNHGGDPGSNTIRVWNLDRGQELMAFEPGNSRAASFAFSPDGKRLVSGMDDGTALVWDLTRR